MSFHFDSCIACFNQLKSKDSKFQFPESKVKKIMSIISRTRLLVTQYINKVKQDFRSLYLTVISIRRYLKEDDLSMADVKRVRRILKKQKKEGFLNAGTGGPDSDIGAQSTFKDVQDIKDLKKASSTKKTTILSKYKKMFGMEEREVRIQRDLQQ